MIQRNIVNFIYDKNQIDQIWSEKPNQTKHFEADLVQSSCIFMFVLSIKPINLSLY